MKYSKVKQGINDIVGDNIKKLAQLFPSAVKDGEVDFEALKEELGSFTEVGAEKYELTWAGKADAKRIAREDIIGKTLKYIPEDSKDADTTENLYIEGDNLEVLKLLRQNYYGAIKMIYIDPPYNTGNDMIYNDLFPMSKQDADLAEENIDEYGERFIINNKSLNRYHANWLNMIYPRLVISKQLLTDDGLIFIAIDDNEIDNLLKVCNEIFGEDNFRGLITRGTGTPTGQGNDRLVREADYMLVYSKGVDCVLGGVPFGAEDEEIYNLEDENGKYLVRPLRKTGGEDRREDRPSMYFPVVSPDGTEVFPIAPSGYESRWRCSKDRYEELLSENRIEWKNDKGVWKVYQKFYLEGRTKQVSNMWTKLEGNKKATLTIKNLFGFNAFDFPKPVEVIKQAIQIATDKDSFVLDFFSGSATTAHSVMQQNYEDKGKRKFILVQLNENCDEKTEAYKHGYSSIAQIGKERIRRAGEKIKSENPDTDIDVGFKVFRVSDTNIKWNSLMDMGQLDVSQIESTPDLMDFMPNTKDIDVVYELMLRQRDVALSESVELLSDIGSRTYLYASSFLVCLETEVTESLVEKIAAIDPLPIKFIFRDSAFKDDIALKDETFRRLKALVEKNSGESKPTYTVEFI